MSLKESVSTVPLDTISQLQDRLRASHVMLVSIPVQQAVHLVHLVPQDIQLLVQAAQTVMIALVSLSTVHCHCMICKGQKDSHSLQEVNLLTT